MAREPQTQFKRIVVLSPHRDDSVFSLAVNLRSWSAREIPCKVLNFFTKSQYAPQLATESIKEITAARMLEDREAIRNISPAIEEQGCDLLDAPLRLSLSIEQIMQPAALRLVSSGEIDDVAQLISRHCGSDLVIAPLALGHHIDHQLISLAAKRAIPATRLAFYEDLPYAAWTPEEEILSRLIVIGNYSGTTYVPRTTQVESAISMKAKAAETYSSQITKEQARDISVYLAKYEGAERTWIPTGDSEWNSI